MFRLARPTVDGMRSAIDLLSSVALIVAAVVVVVQVFGVRWVSERSEELPVPIDPVPIDEGPSAGSIDAPVVMMVFSDFQCPYCAVFFKSTLPSIRANQIETGRVRLLYRHLPLPIHKLARASAELASCSFLNGRFWDAHDSLFESFAVGGAGTLEKPTAMTGMTRDALAACVEREGRDLVVRDMELAKRLGVRGTPTVVIGYRQRDDQFQTTSVLTGARPVADFERALEEASRRISSGDR